MGFRCRGYFSSLWVSHGLYGNCKLLTRREAALRSLHQKAPAGLRARSNEAAKMWPKLPCRQNGTRRSLDGNTKGRQKFASKLVHPTAFFSCLLLS